MPKNKRQYSCRLRNITEHEYRYTILPWLLQIRLLVKYTLGQAAIQQEPKYPPLSRPPPEGPLPVNTDEDSAVQMTGVMVAGPQG